MSINRYKYSLLEVKGYPKTTGLGRSWNRPDFNPRGDPHGPNHLLYAGHPESQLFGAIHRHPDSLEGPSKYQPYSIKTTVYSRINTLQSFLIFGSFRLTIIFQSFLPTFPGLAAKTVSDSPQARPEDSANPITHFSGPHGSQP